MNLENNTTYYTVGNETLKINNQSAFGISFKNREHAIDALISKVFGASVTYTQQTDLCNDPDHNRICAERQETISLRREWNRLDALRIENAKRIATLSAENAILKRMLRRE